MKVVHIGFQYGSCNTGGAAIAATRLHLALLKAGVESHYVCVHQREDGPNVHVLPRQGVSRLVYFALTKLMRCIWRFTSYRRSICLNLIPMFGLKRLLAKIEPDVVHVQWINADVCSFEQLSKWPYRLVFNLHDLYMINAIAPHPKDDTRFLTGFTKSNSRRLERWLFSRKSRLIDRSRAREVSFVGPSNWVASMCRRSLIGKDVPVHVVGNLVDPAIRYHKEWRMPHEQFTILFCAFGGRGNSYKGWGDLESAVHILAEAIECKESVCVNVCGEEAQDYEMSGIKVHFIGIVTEPEKLCKVYHAADILAFPSRQETQGMAKIEALLCGLPVVTFDRTACAEGIIHGQTGWVVADGDINLFVDGLKYYYKKFCHNMISHESIAGVSQKFMSEKKVLDVLMRVYCGSGQKVK